MPKPFIVLAIVIIAVSVAIGFIAMQPDNFMEHSGNKPAAGMEAAPEKEVASQQNGGSNANKPEPETGVTIGKRLPEFKLGTPQGSEVKVVSNGQMTVLNFWATWCPPCRQEMPELEKFSRQYGSKVAFYAINIQESTDKITEFMTRNQYTMQVLTDKEGEVAKKFHINSIPTTLIIDKQGVIRFRKSGPVTVAELEGVLNGL